ncbi:unnamed protein product [Paramecium sonneborni]|uniref:Transmembrane protein n=1 Tax=Paramecium sonneborni TaxID=65129 RepID=A0A8S1RT33_9CILI|nr:unnamed protein product [Paramecium sonneborni]
MNCLCKDSLYCFLVLLSCDPGFVCDSSCKTSLNSSSACSSSDAGFCLCQLTIIKQQTIFNVFAMMDIIEMDQINVSNAQHHVQNVRIIHMVVPNDIQYKCECQYGYFQVDSHTYQQCVSPCQTCESNQNYCLSCVDSNQIVNDFHKCVCKIDSVVNIDGFTRNKCQLPYVSCLQLQINVSLVQIYYINNLNLVNVNLDGYLMIITSAYLEQNHVKLVRYLQLNVLPLGILIKNLIAQNNVFTNLHIILILQTPVQSVQNLLRM